MTRDYTGARVPPFRPEWRHRRTNEFTPGERHARSSHARDRDHVPHGAGRGTQQQTDDDCARPRRVGRQHQPGQVTRQLSRDGYRTVTPELGLNSVAEDVAIVRRRSTGSRVGRCWYPHSYGEGFVGEDQVPEGLGWGEVAASSPPAPPTLAAGSSRLHLFRQYFAQDLTGIRPRHAGSSIWRMGRYRPLAAHFTEGHAVLLIKIDAGYDETKFVYAVRLDGRSAA